jgi:hypothetical protein
LLLFDPVMVVIVVVVVVVVFMETLLFICCLFFFVQWIVLELFHLVYLMYVVLFYKNSATNCIIPRKPSQLMAKTSRAKRACCATLPRTKY